MLLFLSVWLYPCFQAPGSGMPAAESHRLLLSTRIQWQKKKKKTDLAVMGLLCWAWAFSSCGERVCLLWCMSLLRWLLGCAGFSGFSSWALGTGSVVVGWGFSCFMACGIFTDQGSNPCLCLGRWTLYHWTPRGAPCLLCFKDQASSSSTLWIPPSLHALSAIPLHLRPPTPRAPSLLPDWLLPSLAHRATV